MSETPARLLARDESHDVLIVIPTVANPAVLVPSFDRLCRYFDGLRVLVIVSINPLDPAHAAESEEAIRRLWLAYLGRNEGCHLTIYDYGTPAGFGGAINLGLRVALRDTALTPMFDTRPTEVRGIPPLTVIFNDDLHVTKGWLEGMASAVESPTVEEWSELVDPETKERPHHPMSEYVGAKGVGLVGPVTNVAAGIQQIGGEYMERFKAAGVDGFARWWRQERTGSVLTATFLSGYCMGITADCLEELAAYEVPMAATGARAVENHGGVEVTVIPDSVGEPRFAWLFDERFLIAGYEDNDLCARADQKGWRAVVAADTFIGHLGHQTFDESFPEMDRGMRNRLVYYDVWAPRLAQHGRKVVGAYRVRFDVPNDLVMFRASLVSMGRMLDGIAILLTRNPAEMMARPEFQRELSANRIPADMLDLLTGCQRSPSQAPTLLAKWAASWAARFEDSRKPPVQCAAWTGEFHERVERNALLTLAERMGADWIYSVDHDEYLEPRATRALLERMMEHPDPLVQEWDTAFVNHWENNRMYRMDRPWGDGGSYTGAMRGFRFYRVNKANPRRILAGGHNGLHCGNVPMVDHASKRISGLRMRHFGYMNADDRFRKLERYEQQDPNPDPLLVGGPTYGHITRDEGMVLSAFVPENGIGLHMLVHEGERADDVGRLLDQLYGVVDRIVLVWTGTWADEDTGWLVAAGAERSTSLASPTIAGATETDWPQTGPGLAMAKMAAHFGVEWVHHPLADNLAAARNAGIDALRDTPGMGWSLFFDPDEHIPAQGLIHLRRMAEVGDSWGWMVRFVNRHTDGTGNTSEAVRMARLDPLMRMNGRVHESFGHAVKVLQGRNLANILRVAPFTMLNTGLSRDPDTMQRKLDFYRRLTELDLQEDPHNPTAWTTLGLYWLNEGADLAGLECLSRAMRCATGEYIPFREAGLVYGRLAHACMAEAEVRMGNHSLRRNVREAVEALGEIAPSLPRLGHVAAGIREGISNEEAMASLPPFPPPGEEVEEVPTSTRKYMPVAEFRSAGLLQELNRRYLHPMGLALEVVQEADGTERLGGVWDYRDDPEGMVFGEAPDVEKAATVDALFDVHRAVREERFGWHVQPAGAVPRCHEPRCDRGFHPPDVPHSGVFLESELELADAPGPAPEPT